MYFTETAKTIRQEIRAEFKGTGVKVSVRGEHYLSIIATITEAPYDIMKNGSTYEQLNHFYFETDDRITEKGKVVCRKIMQIMRKYHYDNSDAMRDYFDTNYYIHLHVGSWDKPFKKTGGEEKEATGMLELNQESIRRANNVSQFNAGDNIASDAESEYQRFDKMFKDSEEWTEEQREYVAERRGKWQQLIEEAYNEKLHRRADFVPVNVAGPARYNFEKAEKKVEMIFKKQEEYEQKMEKFLDNTRKKLEELTPVEIILERYRNSGASEIIASDDPYAIEKLEAELEYYLMKKPRTRNNNANIRRIKERIEALKRKKSRKNETLEFKGGKVVSNFDIDRLQIYFDEKPSEELRTALKSRGFRCAPSQNYAWQRQLTNNAIYAAKSILKELM